MSTPLQMVRFFYKAAAQQKAKVLRKVLGGHGGSGNQIVHLMSIPR